MKEIVKSCGAYDAGQLKLREGLEKKERHHTESINEARSRYKFFKRCFFCLCLPCA